MIAFTCSIKQNWTDAEMFANSGATTCAPRHTKLMFLFFPKYALRSPCASKQPYHTVREDFFLGCENGLVQLPNIHKQRSEK